METLSPQVPTTMDLGEKSVLTVNYIQVSAQAVKTCVLALLVLLIFHNIRRLLIDRRMKLNGVAPSWWNPLGIELIIWRYLRSTPRIGEAVLNFAMDFCSEFSKERLARAWVFNVPIIVVYKPEIMELVLSSNTIIDKSQFYEPLHAWLGTGLLTSAGAKWRLRRKMLTPAFHFKILEDFMPIFNEQAMTLVRRLEAVGQSKTFDIVHYVTGCTLDIVCETAMGASVNAQGNPDSEYVQAIYSVGERFLDRLTKPWLWPNFIFDYSSVGRSFNKSVGITHDFTRKVIHERLAAMKATLEKSGGPRNAEEIGTAVGQKKRKPFLDLLLERHLKEGDLSLEDIREEVDTFMFEGHDTTAMGISWTLHLLAQNPECQRKVQKELDTIFADDISRLATMEDLAHMKYLEGCIKEAQRLYPSVPFVARTLREDLIYKKSVIPAGTTAVLVFYALHRDPELFPNPEKFDPDRFSPDNSVARHPYSYVPFSAGPRNCIGQRFALNEEKVVVSWLLRKFWLESQVVSKDLHILAELVTRSADGLHLNVKPRVPSQVI